jgi:hypothetical protein
MTAMICFLLCNTELHIAKKCSASSVLDQECFITCRFVVY